MHYQYIGGLPSDGGWIAVFVIVMVLIPLALTVALMIYVIRVLLKAVGSGDSETLQKGIRRTATIQSIKETGTYVNYSPQVELSLLVAAPTGPQPAMVTTIIPVTQIPLYQPGRQIDVLAHPDDPARVALIPEARQF